MNFFSRTSDAHLAGCHPDLARLHHAVLSVVDHSVVDGVRTLDEQKTNVAKGVSKTLDSKHLPQSDGLSHATDSVPYPPPDWGLIDKCIDAVRKIDPTLGVFRFYWYQGVVKGTAAQMGINIRQGIDWDGDTDVGDQSFIDLPHNELRSP